MKFSTGFLAGAVVGGYIAANMTPDQRSRFVTAATTAVDKVRSNSIASSLADNVSEVADAASERVTGLVETAGSAIADTVAPSHSETDSKHTDSNQLAST